MNLVQQRPPTHGRAGPSAPSLAPWQAPWGPSVREPSASLRRRRSSQRLQALAFLQETLRRAAVQGKAACEQPKRARQDICRPGIPKAWDPRDPNAFRVADRPSPPLRDDDKDGHYVFELGENLTSRYKILSKMGEGTFGRVLECWDRKHKDYVAIKIVRNIDKYRHAAMIELEVLNTLERNDVTGEFHCVRLREWFDYRGHVCMVFEKLGPSLFDFLRRNEYRPFPLDLVQTFGRQLLESVAYLHELRLIHTDLKPENILLVALDYCKTTTAANGRRPAASRVVPTSSTIKVIDFGSATFEEGHHSSVVSTRHYRAPEVILGLGWSYPCDMWSVGCILVELLTGDALFQTHENLEHLAMMEAVLGPLPAGMAGRAHRNAAKYFTGSRLTWPEGAASKKSVKTVGRLHTLRRHILESGDPSAVPHLEVILDLISGLLRYEAGDRMTAAEALSHPFFRIPLQASIPSQAPGTSVGGGGSNGGSGPHNNVVPTGGVAGGSGGLLGGAGALLGGWNGLVSAAGLPLIGGTGGNGAAQGPVQGGGGPGAAPGPATTTTTGTTNDSAATTHMGW